MKGITNYMLGMLGVFITNCCHQIFKCLKVFPKLVPEPTKFHYWHIYYQTTNVNSFFVAVNIKFYDLRLLYITFPTYLDEKKMIFLNLNIRFGISNTKRNAPLLKRNRYSALTDSSVLEDFGISTRTKKALYLYLYNKIRNYPEFTK